MPFTLFMVLTFSERIAVLSSSALRDDRMIRAVLTPTPDTLMRVSNRALSSLDEKP